MNLIYETLDCGKKWVVDINAEKTQLMFDQPNNIDAIDFNMNGSVLEEN